MQLNLSTDYAIRSMVHLAQMPGGDSASGISKMIGIERVHTQKILRSLQKADLVKSTMGSMGGFSLTRPPDTITLLDIIIAMEKTILINRCLEEDRFCSLTRTHVCPVRSVYINLQTQVEDYLRSWSLTKLLEEAK
ncbi:MAG: Rrf2 family transcriptional regulator [Clostridiales bacterium]|nr:Rrf2 family transcriptional regulator [Clostridiales bacterium]